jgi:hypothetical protein
MPKKSWACIAAVRALLARDDLTHEQRQTAEFVLSELQKLSHVKKLTQRDISRCVGQIAEKLIDSFAKIDKSH